MTATWLRFPPPEAPHLHHSREMIAEAALPGGDRAVVLGAGACQDIPLALLRERFAAVLLVDQQEASSLPLPTGVESHRQDLTGLTEDFLRQVAACLTQERDPDRAGQRLGALARAALPPPPASLERYDLVVASCVLSQLHLQLYAGSVQAYRARFPHHDLRRQEGWGAAMVALNRRLEVAFLERVCRMVAPGGRLYLSATSQSAVVHATAEGDWLTPGWRRMVHHPQGLGLLDQRLRAVARREWLWAAPPPVGPGASGCLYRVQAGIWRGGADWWE